MKTGPKPQPLIERIERFVELNQRGCWLWLGSLHPHDGYGMMTVGSRTRWAHRIAYQTFIGDVPVGLQLDHLCRERRCVNPTHLEPVTCRENLLRGEGFSARNARKTHCVHGHVLTGRNLYISPTGRRNCRACRLSSQLAYQGRLRHQRFGTGA